MVDLAPLGTAVSTVQNLSGVILVTPNVDKGIMPQPTGGAASPVSQAKSFFFHYRGSRKVRLESDIPDHRAEDNTFLQNQIALKPEQIQEFGYIAELTDFLEPGSAQAAARQAVDKLVLLQTFMPQVSLTALLAYNAAAQVYATAANAAQSVQSTLSAFGVGGPTQNKQQTAYVQFDTWWRTRTLFTIQTPWRIFKNVAIQYVEAEEEEATTGWTSFKVAFKPMTFTSQAGGAIQTGSNTQGRLAAAASPEVNFGTGSGVPGPDLSSQLSASGFA